MDKTLQSIQVQSIQVLMGRYNTGLTNHWLSQSFFFIQKKGRFAAKRAVFCLRQASIGVDAESRRAIDCIIDSII